ITAFRLLLSDGQRITQVLLATQLNHLAIDGLLTTHCLVRVSSLKRSKVQEKEIIIALGLEIVKKQNDKLGDPQNIETHGPTFVQQAKATSAPPRPATINKGSSKSTNKGLQTASDMKGRPTINPIAELSPYQNGWTIKARIASKSDIKVWSNERGSGQLFSFVMIDETQQIKGTAFKDDADNLFAQVQEGRVYYISRGKIVPAKKQYNRIDNQDYEIVFDHRTTVEPCDDESNMPEIDLSYTPLANLQDLSKDTICNVLGVVTAVEECKEIVMKKTQRPLVKRDLTIVDRSGFSCPVTLWGKPAEEFEAQDNPVVSFRGLKVGDFHGRSLSYQNGSSRMLLDPDLVDAHALRGWFDEVGVGQTFQSCQGASASRGTSAGLNREELMKIADVKNTNVGMKETGYFTAKLRVAFTKNVTKEKGSFCYPACRKEDCRKKVDLIEGFWRCVKCEGVWTEPDWRYTTSISAADHHDFAWFSVFNELAEELFEKKAIDLQKVFVRSPVLARCGLADRDCFRRLAPTTMNSSSTIGFLAASSTISNAKPRRT
ncbi:replication factor-A protein 1, partial [Calocera viscosa TUFC12733]